MTRHGIAVGLILLTLFCGGLVMASDCGVAVAETTTNQNMFHFPVPEKDKSALIKVPKYLLALRYWGMCNKAVDGRRDSVVMTWDWIYLYEVYDTTDQILSRIKQNCGWDEQSVVGCWRLTDDRQVKITVRRVEKSEPVRIEARKWTELEWEIEEEAKP